MDETHGTHCAEGIAFSPSTCYTCWCDAVERNLDLWIPACGGTETPFLMRGYRLLYCFNPATKEHNYINLDTDCVLSTDDALSIFRILSD